jgi:hypothetical protein
MPRKKAAESAEALINAPLPDSGSPDYFKALVQNRIQAYEKLNNNSLALNFCKVSDRRLRTLVLSDEEDERVGGLR